MWAMWDHLATTAASVLIVKFGCGLFQTGTSHPNNNNNGYYTVRSRWPTGTIGELRARPGAGPALVISCWRLATNLVPKT